MAHFLISCHRGERPPRHRDHALRQVAERLRPDGVADPDVRVVDAAGLSVLSIDAELRQDAEGGVGVCVGHRISGDDNWHRAGSDPPDGALAIGRGDAGTVEVLTDALASRAVWVFHDVGRFIASTSLRALIAVVGDVEVDPRATAGLLTRGCHDPGVSWDRRVWPVPAASVVTLDRRDWTVSTKSTWNPAAPMVPADRTDADHVDALRAVVTQTCGHCDFPADWAVPLSGGVDSRALLSMLRRPRGLRTFSTGPVGSPADRSSDTAVAARVAAHFGLSHRHFDLDPAAADTRDVLRRFVANGEARVDHVAGYLDGFATWRTLRGEGVRGLIRGDECFGWVPVSFAEEVPRSVGASPVSEVPQLSGLPGCEDLVAAATQPDWMARAEGETLPAWRDRLYHAFRVPCILGPLTTLKSPYVETANPLLARAVVSEIRRLPDHLRTSKAAFARVAAGVSPKLPFATERTDEAAGRFLKETAAREELTSGLDTSAAAGLLPTAFLDRAIDALATPAAASPPSTRRRLARWSRAVLPPAVRSRLKRRLPPAGVPWPTLALRGYLAARLVDLLHEDIAAVSTSAAKGG